MICTKCGTQNEEKSNFCEKCGNKIVKEKNKIEIKTIGTWIAIVFLCIMALSMLSERNILGALLLIPVVLLLPPVKDILDKKKINVNKRTKNIIIWSCIIFVIFGNAIIGGYNSAITHNNISKSKMDILKENIQDKIYGTRGAVVDINITQTENQKYDVIVSLEDTFFTDEYTVCSKVTDITKDLLIYHLEDYESYNELIYNLHVDGNLKYIIVISNLDNKNRDKVYEGISLRNANNNIINYDFKTSYLKSEEERRIRQAQIDAEVKAEIEAEAKNIKLNNGDFTLLDGHSLTKEDNIYYINGYIKNNTNRAYSYIQILFNVYNNDGEQIGTAMANMNNLEANGTWKFKAFYIGNDTPVSYKNPSISVW